MNVTVEDLGACRKRMRVEVPANDVGEEIDKITKEFHAVARLPGFRTGKAPLSLVAKRYAKDIDDEVRRKVIPSSLQKALADRKLHVVGSPVIEEMNYERGLCLSYSVELETQPEFILPEYRGIPLVNESVEPTDEEYKTTVDRLRQEYATFADVEGRSLEAEDFAVVNISGSSEGRPLEEISAEAKPWGERKSLWLRVAEEGWLPGFALQLVGMAIGEKRDVTITFQENFPVKELAGKPAVYVVELEKIKQRVLPEVNDEFSQMVLGKPSSEFEVLVRALLVDRKEHELRVKHQNAISEHLLGAVQFDVPESLVKSHARIAIQDMVRRAQMQGMSNDDMAAKHQEIFDAATTSAREHVKLNYILLRIAEAEKLEVTAEEMEDKLAQLARQYKMEPSQLTEIMMKNSGFGKLEEDVMIEKSIDFLVKEAKFSDA
jgi:trigger factor